MVNLSTYSFGISPVYENRYSDPYYLEEIRSVNTMGNGSIGSSFSPKSYFNNGEIIIGRLPNTQLDSDGRNLRFPTGSNYVNTDFPVIDKVDAVVDGRTIPSNYSDISAYKEFLDSLQDIQVRDTFGDIPADEFWVEGITHLLKDPKTDGEGLRKFLDQLYQELCNLNYKYYDEITMVMLREFFAMGATEHLKRLSEDLANVSEKLFTLPIDIPECMDGYAKSKSIAFALAEKLMGRTMLKAWMFEIYDGDFEIEFREEDSIGYLEVRLEKLENLTAKIKIYGLDLKISDTLEYMDEFFNCIMDALLSSHQFQGPTYSAQHYPTRIDNI
jgi:hypothetical protein